MAVNTPLGLPGSGGAGSEETSCSLGGPCDRRLGENRAGQAGIERCGVDKRLEDRSGRPVRNRMIVLAGAVIPSPNQSQNLPGVGIQRHQCHLGIDNGRVIARFDAACMQFFSPAASTAFMPSVTASRRLSLQIRIE